MTTTTIPTPKIPTSQSGKAARLGLPAGLPRTPQFAGLRAVMRGLRESLDALRDNPDLSPNERRVAARRHVADAQRAAATAAEIVAAMKARATTAATEITAKVRKAENALSLVEVERLKNQAADVRALPIADRGEAVRKLVDRGVARNDLSALIAASMVSPAEPTIRRAIAAIVAGPDLQSFLVDGPAAVAAEAALRNVNIGLAELAAVDDPCARDVTESAALLLNNANGSGAASLGFVAASPREWPADLQEVAEVQVEIVTREGAREGGKE